jgi:hypothetical protein
MTGTDHIARHIREAAAAVRAPEQLHAHVAEEVARRRPARRRQTLAVGGALAGGLAAIAVALVLVLSGGGTSMGDAVALALRPPSTDAPAMDPADPGHLQAQVGGVRFPTYPGWEPTGERTDEIGGRRAVTVAYRSADRGPVSYTIVDGDPLGVPGDARWTTLHGFRVAVLRDDGTRVVTWEQGGRTCILAGGRDDVTALLRDAAVA